MKKIKKRGVDVLIFDGKKEAAREAAEIIAKEIKKNPSLRLGLATGKTMMPVYRELVSIHKKRKVNFSKVKISSSVPGFHPRRAK